jgi:hypothetical protein
MFRFFVNNVFMFCQNCAYSRQAFGPNPMLVVFLRKMEQAYMKSYIGKVYICDG